MAEPIKISTETRESIHRLLLDGLTLKEVSSKVGYSLKIVNRTALELGLAPKGAVFYLSPKEMEEGSTRYKAGESLRTIGISMRLCPLTLQRAFVNVGIPIRRRTLPIEKEDSFTHDYHITDLTLDELERKHDIGRRIIKRIVRERCLIRQNPPERAWDKRRRCTMYQGWVEKHGEEGAKARQLAMTKKQSANSRGENNPMHGRPSPQGSGNGWKGWYKGTHFRSLRELFFIVNVLEKEGLQWESGEKGGHRIPYVDCLGVKRTYCPDYVVMSRTIYEIKPERLWNTPSVLSKANAARKKCADMGLEYVLVDPPIDNEQLLNMYRAGHIEWMSNTEKRFRAYYGLDESTPTTPPRCAA